MNVSDWMHKYYKLERFRNEPGFHADREQRLIGNRLEDLAIDGFACISAHDSTTGRPEYYGAIPSYVRHPELVGLTPAPTE